MSLGVGRRWARSSAKCSRLCVSVVCGGGEVNGWEDVGLAVRGLVMVEDFSLGWVDYEGGGVWYE